MLKKLTIPVPQQTLHMYRGFSNKTTTMETVPVSIRWTDDDHHMINTQAHRLGITFSEFVRWCAYHSAAEVDKYHINQRNKIAARKAALNMDDYTDDTQ